MSLLRNLVPGQYQIGDLVFGKGTTVRVETFDVKTYDVNSTDYQVSRADENRFGWDQLKPTTIEITFHVLKNKLRPGFEDLIPNFWSEMPTVADFQKEWKSDELRYQWGAMKNLYKCDPDGITKAIFGRPGQFTYGEDSAYTEAVQCLGEFRRADTVAYGVIYNEISFDSTHLTKTIHGTNGDAPSWINMLIQGPITNPVITFDGLCNEPNPVAFPISRTVAADEVIQITGEPWTRRAVSSTVENIAADVGQYLDKLRFYNDTELGVTLAGTGMTTDTGAVILFRDGYQTV